MYSKTCFNQTSSEPTFVFSLHVYTEFQFIQGSVETGFTILANKSNRKSTQKNWDLLQNMHVASCPQYHKDDQGSY